MGLADVSVLVGVLLCSLLYLLRNSELQLDRIDAEIVSTSPVVPTAVIGAYRLFMFAVVALTTTQICVDKNGLVISVFTASGKVKTVELLHFQRLTTFTVWCWILIGLYSLCASLCSFGTLFYGSCLSEQFVWLTAILFEAAFTFSFLVTSVVTFVLVPAAKAKNLPVKMFFTPIPVILHNLNSAFMAIEMILNKLPIAWTHLPFVQCFGLAYVLFAWLYVYRKLGVVYYFFLDYNRPYAVVWYFGLFVLVT
jgi:hypothetical protein